MRATNELKMGQKETMTLLLTSLGIIILISNLCSVFYDGNNEAKMATYPVPQRSFDGAVSGAEQICSLLSEPHLPSLDSFWKSQMENTRQALLHSPVNNPFGTRTDEMQRMIDQVFQFLSPRRLRKSLRPQSTAHEMHAPKIHRLLNVLWNRYRRTDAPKLKVIVFGGSPSAGSNCERNKNYSKNGACAWPGHLEGFVNDYLGFDAIEVKSYAMGGTSSEVASAILDYRLFPSSMLPDGPDIIINAYAVNDFLRHHDINGVSSHHDRDAKSFQSLFEDFMLKANNLRSCDGERPLLIYLDDFILNPMDDGKNVVQIGADFSSEIAKLTQWYQVMTVGYGDMVRDFVYQDGVAQKLLVDWQHDRKHPTWAGHVAIVTAFAFNAMNMVLEFCSDSAYDKEFSVLPTDRDGDKNEAVLDPYFRPPLDTNLVLPDVPKIWRQRQKDWKCSGPQTSCPFAWVAMHREKDMQHLPDIPDVLQEKKGWSHVTKWPPSNYGLLASSGGSLLLNLSKYHGEVNVISIMYMKSYSEKWKDSLLEVNVYKDNTASAPIATKRLSGFHEKRTSEYFYGEIHFEAFGSDQDLLLSMKLVSGQTFKVVGISFCMRRS